MNKTNSMHLRIHWFFAAGALVLLLFVGAGLPWRSLTYAQMDSTNSKTVIALAADLDQNKPQPLWNTVLRTNPDLFLFLGDNVYLDTADENVMRAKYAKLGAMPGYLKLLAKDIPIIAMWDDHDYGADDAGTEFPQKEISKKVFLDFFREPVDSPRRTREGIYDAKIFGEEGKRVQIISLDLRTFRSPLKKSKSSGGYVPNEDSSATVLGEEQWKWLQDELKKPAEVRIIMSSIQVIVRGNGWENWMNFPLERTRLFNLIRETGANGVVFVSGDRHSAELSITDGGVGYPMHDFTTGSFNKAPKIFSFEKNLYRLGAKQSSENFGLITVEWASYGQKTWLTLEARDINNNSIIYRRLPISILRQGVL